MSSIIRCLSLCRVALVLVLAGWLQLAVISSAFTLQMVQRSSTNSKPYTTHQPRSVRIKNARSSPKVVTKSNDDVFDIDSSGSSSNTAISEVRLSGEERLQKILARAGIASRRKAEVMIAEGRVQVNSKTITELGFKINPRKDKITVDNKLVTLPTQDAIHWIALFKPKGYLTTMSDDKDRDSILSLMPKAHNLHLVPVGRMSRDATGLILLTNEVGWVHPLTHPSYSNRKKYELVVKGLLRDEQLEPLRRGMQLANSKELFPSVDEVQILDYDEGNHLTLLRVTVDETSPSMLDDMLLNMDSEIVGCKCIEFNGVALRGLKKGEWKELNANEISKVKSFCKPRNLNPHQKVNNAGNKVESYSREGKHLQGATRESRFSINKSTSSSSSSSSYVSRSNIAKSRFGRAT